MKDLLSLDAMEKVDIGAMVRRQRTFVAERKWQRFHTPKNLSMALVGEATELMEIFQWLSQAEGKSVMKVPGRAKAVRHEMADVLFYLLRMADVLGVDLEEAFRDKMRHNEEKYPVKVPNSRLRRHQEFLAAKGLNAR